MGKELQIDFDFSSVEGLAKSFVDHQKSTRKSFVSSWYLLHAVLVLLTTLVFVASLVILEHKFFENYFDTSSNYYSYMSSRRMKQDIHPMILVDSWMVVNLIFILFYGLTYLKARNTQSNLAILFALCIFFSLSCFFLGILFAFFKVRTVYEWENTEMQTGIEKWGKGSKNIMAMDRLISFQCFVYSYVYVWFAWKGYLVEESLLSVDEEFGPTTNTPQQHVIRSSSVRSASPSRSSPRQHAIRSSSLRSTSPGKSPGLNPDRSLSLRSVSPSNSKKNRGRFGISPSPRSFNP
mmetsp:Transcript_33407/g.77066  ORF Transcript_33407/g.77066 Transcript_33407/m.77066 type:complete len:293 (-) Transcript_33407:394-1272(-)